MPNEKIKKPKKEKKYIVVDDETDNALAEYHIFAKNGDFKTNCSWVYDFDKALVFTSLKLANTIMNELGHCHIEVV